MAPKTRPPTRRSPPPSNPAPASPSGSRRDSEDFNAEDAEDARRARRFQVLLRPGGRRRNWDEVGCGLPQRAASSLRVPSASSALSLAKPHAGIRSPSPKMFNAEDAEDARR